MTVIRNNYREQIENSMEYRLLLREIYSRGFERRCEEWNFDLRPLLTDPKFLRKISDIISMIPLNYKDKQVCGIDFSGIPISVAISQLFPERFINNIIYRKEKVSKTNKNNIEGFIHDMPTILIDDVFSSGKTCLKAMTLLRNYIRQPIEILSIIDFCRDDIVSDIEHTERRSIFNLIDFGIDEFKHI